MFNTLIEKFNFRHRGRVENQCVRVLDELTRLDQMASKQAIASGEHKYVIAADTVGEAYQRIGHILFEITEKCREYPCCEEITREEVVRYGIAPHCDDIQYYEAAVGLEDSFPAGYYCSNCRLNI